MTSHHHALMTGLTTTCTWTVQERKTEVELIHKRSSWIVAELLMKME